MCPLLDGFDALISALRDAEAERGLSKEQLEFAVRVLRGLRVQAEALSEQVEFARTIQYCTELRLRIAGGNEQSLTFAHLADPNVVLFPVAFRPRPRMEATA